jgi:acyl-coenzyme A thioesterase PaaI-like protein
MLRDLALTVEHHEDGTSAGRLPVVDALLDDHGRVRAGILATLVDAIGGGLAAYAAAPGWIATADLDLQLFGTLTGVTAVDAIGRVLRAGRSTVVLSVVLSAEGTFAPLGLATMTFAVLPRRDTNPVMPDDRATGPQSFIAGTTTGFTRAALDAFGLRTVDVARGHVELEPTGYVENSLGAVQGGAVATMVERAAELALSHAARRPLAPVGLQLSYLALAREGPIRSAVEVLGTDDRWGSARVELFDAGADRRTTVGRVVACSLSRSLDSAWPSTRALGRRSPLATPQPPNDAGEID